MHFGLALVPMCLYKVCTVQRIANDHACASMFSTDSHNAETRQTWLMDGQVTCVHKQNALQCQHQGQR